MPDWPSEVYGLIGTVVGALLVLGGQFLSTLFSWFRENRYRNHEERRRVYADFLGACERINNKVSTGRAAFVEIKVGLFSIRLISRDKKVIDAAESLVMLFALPSTSPPGSTPPVSVSPSQYQAALDRFFESARRELGEKPKPQG